MSNTVYFGTGIDLGTTNSVAATAMMQDGRLISPVIAIERDIEMSSRGRFKSERRDLLPSCVAYIEKNDGKYEPNVGDFAKKLSYIRPFSVASSIKSQMGQPAVNISGWKPQYPDQKPEEISARILAKIRDGLSNQLGVDIKDAVITVPASFNPAQCEATLRAAEIAGFNVRKPNGAFREDILLSEPEAVIYDVINQLQNGSLHLPVDFTSPRNILVYDIGGGTLDITLHSICKNPEYSGTYDIRPLATNRYSTVAGDTFDKVLAEKMYEKFLDEWKQEDMENARKIAKGKDNAMPHFLRYAEELKMDVGRKYQQQKNIGKILSPEEQFDYGGDLPDGDNCENYMELWEFEETLKPLMGEEFTYQSYQNMSGIEDTNNIIYPLLNVLEKAAHKLNTRDVQVDAVILNGGMSRLYLIENRLERFFGFRMTKVSDPDKSVAQGAAVYHYNLQCGNTVLMDRHKNFMEEQRSLEDTSKTGMIGTVWKTPSIRTVGSIQNESLYIGLAGGSVHEIISSGTDLPYESPLIEGFSIAPYMDRMYLPIRQAGTRPGSYETIASGSIHVGKKFREEMPVAIRFLLRRDGIMTLNAWVNGEHVGDTTIIFGDIEHKLKQFGRKKMLPPDGTILNVANELSSFCQIAERLKKPRKGSNSADIQKMKLKKKTLLHCGNPQDFSTAMLDLLQKDRSPVIYGNLLPVMRQFCEYWTEEERKKLSKICLDLLQEEFHGWGPKHGFGVNANIEAIQTIGICGIKEDCKKLEKLRSNPSYRSALLRAYGLCGMDIDWIFDVFCDRKRRGFATQDALQAIALFLQNSQDKIDETMRSRICEMILHHLDEIDLQGEINITVVTLGLLCVPLEHGGVNESLRKRVELTLQSHTAEYSERDGAKALSVAVQLLQGNNLEDEQEQYLLGLLG